MSVEALDFIFPFIVLGYGALMTLVLNTPKLMVLAEARLPKEILKQMMAHRMLALVSLVIGSLWSLQNIWIA